jgi:hypothetical protein
MSILALKPEIIHHFSDGLYAKESVFPAGMSTCIGQSHPRTTSPHHSPDSTNHSIGE